MKPKEVAARLNENERKLLHALSGGETATTEKLSKLTGLGRDAVEKASDWAMTKGVVEFSEEVSFDYSVTEEGKKYVLMGLPEEQLLRLISEVSSDLAKLRDELPIIEVAIGRGMRKKWFSLENSKFVISETGWEALEEKSPEQILLEKIAVHSLIDESDKDLFLELARRNLARLDSTTTRYVNITEFGTQVLPELSELETVNIITQLSPELLSTGGWKGSRFQEYDVSLPVPNTLPGKRHFISQIIDYIRRFWVELGFKEMKGEYLELNFWNFDALYQPQDHPARDLADTFYMKTPYKGHLPDAEMVERVKLTHENGWTTGSKGWQYNWDPELSKRTVLRTHTTSLSVNQIAKLKKEDLPAKFFSVGRVFRNETIDWNHLAEFYQTDGIVIGEDVTFRDMKGYLKAYLEGLGLTKFRFRPAYFPYTEMSMEAEVWIEERGSWMELFGAGMFRPEVVKPLLGIDVPVLAWGPGFDRLVMQSYKVNNIKELYSNDIGLLRRAKLWTR